MASSFAPPLAVHLTPASLRACLQNPHGRGAVLAGRPQVAEQVVGNAVHSTLAWLFRRPVDQRSAVEASRALSFFWAQEVRTAAWTSSSQRRAWLSVAAKLVSSYCTGRALAANTVAVECQVRAVLACGATLSGRVDRIDACPGGGIEVIDYKTGRCGLAEDALGSVVAAQLYAVAAQQTLAAPVRLVRFVYLRSSEQRVWRPHEGEIAELAARFDTVARRSASAPVLAVAA